MQLQQEADTAAAGGQHRPHRLACTASGQSFEDWKRRPVYKTHCATTAVARRLCIPGWKPGTGLATCLSGDDSTGLTTFRALRPYRSVAANALRAQVAAIVRADRQQQRVA